MFSGLVIFNSIVGHEMCKFANGKGDVRSGTILQIHTFSNKCAVRKRGSMTSFTVVGRAHSRCEMKRGAWCFNHVAVLHIEVG